VSARLRLFDVPQSRTPRRRLRKTRHGIEARCVACGCVRPDTFWHRIERAEREKRLAMLR
jgi:hypothetical protein